MRVLSTKDLKDHFGLDAHPQSPDAPLVDLVRQMEAVITAKLVDFARENLRTWFQTSSHLNSPKVDLAALFFARIAMESSQGKITAEESRQIREAFMLLADR